MEKLHDEGILHNIMVRLPVNSILRCRCVSKSWCKLLRDPYFVKEHLRRTSEMNEFSLMVSVSSSRNYTLAYDPSSSTLSDRVFLTYPSKYMAGFRYFWGSCNGVICLTPEEDEEEEEEEEDEDEDEDEEEEEEDEEEEEEEVLLLWNPATNEFKEVPIESPRCESIRSYVYHGFHTYNDEFDDFKVVRFEGAEGRLSCQVQVYTLKSNSWRRLENIPYLISDDSMMRTQVIVRGAMHFLGFTASDDMAIVSFDFKDDKFKELPAPDFCDAQDKLCSLRDSLCLLCSVREIRIDVWEMKTYGVTESWAKLFTIGQNTIYGYFYSLVPLQFVSDDRVLLACDQGDFRLHLYDLKRGTSINLKADDEDTCASFTFVYLKSLVMLNSGAYVEPPETDSQDFEENDDDVGEELRPPSSDVTPNLATSPRPRPLKSPRTTTEATSSAAGRISSTAFAGRRIGAATSSTPARGRVSRGGAAGTSAAARGRGSSAAATAGTSAAARGRGSTTSTAPAATRARGRGARDSATARGRGARGGASATATGSTAPTAATTTIYRGRGARGGVTVRGRCARGGAAAT